MHRPTSHLAHCVLSLAARRTQTAAQLGSLARVCYGDFCWSLLLLLLLFLFLFIFLKLVFNIASAPNSEAVSAIRISLMASSSSYIFFPAMALRPTIVCLVYTIYDWPELRKHYTSKDTNVFYSDSKTDLKLRCNCVWNSSYSGVPKTFLVDWRRCVSCYYPTTPTDYPSTTRGRSVGPPVAANIVICGYVRFLSITLNYMGAVGHWQTIWSEKSFRYIGQCWYFSPMWTPERAIIKASSVRTQLVSWEKCAVTKCLCIYRCLGGAGGTFGLLNESLAFKGPET
jgi:hypothetical protein